MPRPWSSTSMTTPLPTTLPRTSTRDVGGENVRRVVDELGDEVDDVGDRAALDVTSGRSATLTRT